MTIDWGTGFIEIGDPPPINPTPSADWPSMPMAAYHGLPGEVVAVLGPHTESDQVALLLQYLVSFGNCVGRRPYFQTEDTRHYPNLFAVMVGNTAKARKGTSADRIRRIFDIADAAWAHERTLGGMSSGEGVIWAVHDPIFTLRKGIEELSDPGIDDKRLLLDEREFYQALAVLKREGSILSRVVRDAWDGREILATLTKHSPTRATGAHISIIGHITSDELRQVLDHTAMANGYANRFLFTCVRRSKMLPRGGALDAQAINLLGAKTLEVLTTARSRTRMSWSEDGGRMWDSVYPNLSAEQPGMLGAIVARAEAQTARLALIYALLDGAPQIERLHLEAALAVWAYCEGSARYIFGDLIGDPIADTILRELRNAGAAGRSRTDLNNLFHGNISSARIDQALILLLKNGKARREIQPSTGGRPRETWFAIQI